MKKFIKYSFVGVLAFLASGCNDYLDVVPDNTQEISALFNRKEEAYKALATCYHYIPEYDNTYSVLGMSDEMIMGIDRLTVGKMAVLGQVSADNPLMSYWRGPIESNWTAPCEASLFIPLRICNVFLNNIDRVPDMTQSDITRWASEVKFLKAYYHFLLFSQYGAIPLIKEETALDVTDPENMVDRRPVDEVVDYIVELLDEAYQGLPIRIINTSELGRIDQVICAALKAKVLLYAASPLFNNNPMYYELANADGTKLFPQNDAALEKAKWERALNAYKEAIAICQQANVKLFFYPEDNFATNIDAMNYKRNPERLPYMYNYQYAMVTNWNEEVIWGLSRPASSGSNSWHDIQKSINFKHATTSEGTSEAWQWFGPTLNATEFFYTKNGLPIDEDPEFDYENRDALTTIPTSHREVAIPNEQTAYMFLNREPRFYASIGFDRSIVRGYGTLYQLKMRYQEGNGRQSHTDIDVPTSGVFLRKLMHPDTKGNGTITKYAWPILRFNEMLLSYAECLNEVGGEAAQAEVLEVLNQIRSRAGVPTVEESWANAFHANKYQTKEGMREIIKQERTIELAFEGYRNDDVRRWLEGIKYFNAHVWQWNADETSASAYYQRIEDPKLLHVFTARNYLWPIPTDELVKNPKLVQNPGY